MMTKTIPILNETNYLTWRESMKAFLITRKLWEAIQGFPNEDGEATDFDEFTAAEKQKDEEAQIVILQGVEDQLLADIAKQKTARDRWLALEKVHCDYSSVDVASLFYEISVSRKDATTTMRQYTGKLEETMEKIVDAGVDFPDGVRAALLLPGLPRKKYEGLISQFRVEDKTLSYLHVKSRLIRFAKQEEIGKARTQEEATAHLIGTVCKYL